MTISEDQLANARKLLGWAARIDTLEHVELYLHSNPVLFIPRIASELRQQVKRLSSSEDRFARRLDLMNQPHLPDDDPELSWHLLTETLEEILDRIDELRTKYERHEDQFPLGAGAIEGLWSSLDAGALRVEEAEEMARVGLAAQSMAPTYVYALSNHTVNLTHAGQYSKALTYHRILLAAVDVTEVFPEYSENMNVVASDWIEIVLDYLSDIPDARLFRDAVERGKKVIERTSISDPNLWRALTLHRLGVLHLEPYVRGRTPESFTMQEKIWRAKFLSQPGADLNLPESVWQMPPLETALPIAESYLRQARMLRKGEEKALSTKALVETLSWQHRLGILPLAGC
jgi:hypothetical protein